MAGARRPARRRWPTGAAAVLPGRQVPTGRGGAAGSGAAAVGGACGARPRRAWRWASWRVRCRSGRSGRSRRARAGGLPEAGSPYRYTFDDGASPVRGAATTGDAPRLDEGTVYRDSLAKSGKRIYRVDLDAASHAYVSAVAVPRTGGKVAFTDAVTVSLQDENARDCNSSRSSFGSADFPRPLAVYAHRTLGPDTSTCRQAGSYYVVVERQTQETSSADDWDLELRFTTEPTLKEGGPAAAPSTWPSASPGVPSGGPRERRGGSGVSDAPGLSDGEWADRIEPGQSRFYRIPVDWGQQLFLSAHLSSSTGDGFVSDAVSCRSTTRRSDSSTA